MFELCTLQRTVSDCYGAELQPRTCRLRFSQQRHLGGIGAPAAAEQSLAYTGAFCRARTRVRREQELS